jgi:hypothetical protein
VGDAKAAGAPVRSGTPRGIPRRRTVGIRDQVITHLEAVGEVTDAAGMASTKLAEAVGYPGSSVAFAQLLSGMERDGLIEREVRGKRTYRITLPARGTIQPARVKNGRRAAAPHASSNHASHASTGHGGHASAGHPGAADDDASDFDYDELARRLLIQVVRRLAASQEPAAGQQEEPGGRSVVEPEETALKQTVAGLERELATAWSQHGSLTAENVRLREQLREAQRDLKLAREQTPKLPVTDELDRAEVLLLERLLDRGARGDRDGRDEQADRDDQPGANAS